MRTKQQYLLAAIMRLLTAGSIFLAVLPVVVPEVSTQPLAPLSCAPPANGIAAENCLQGNLLSYKETHYSAVVDPADLPARTGTWRDPRFSLPADGERPENALTGPVYAVRTHAADNSSKLETSTAGTPETVAASPPQ